MAYFKALKVLTECFPEMKIAMNLTFLKKVGLKD